MTDLGNGPDQEEPNNAGLDELASNAPEQPTDHDQSQQDEPLRQPESERPEEDVASTREPAERAAPAPEEPVSQPEPEPAPAAMSTDVSTNSLPSPGEQGIDEVPTGGAPVEQVGAEQVGAEQVGEEQAGEEQAGEEQAPVGEAETGEPHAAPRRGGQRAWRPPRMSKEEMREVWTELQGRRDAGEEIELEVVGHNRGGVVTQYKGLEVFVPMSHWSLERQSSTEPSDVKVGSSVRANILEITDFETDARRVTATRRGTLRKGMLHAYEVGQHLTGTVASIHDFGIFVDLGGIDGLVHASEISHVRGKHPSELVKVGDQVDVVVKEIDPQRERIYLGMRELGPSPWDHVDEKYPADSMVEGKVVGFSKNGAFIEVEPGVEGFIRMRELSWTKRVQRPKDVLKKGATIPVKVLEVNGRRQRLSLSYRQAVEDPWPQIAEKYAVGTTWKGAITELSNKGVVVDLGEVEGFLPRGRMGREAKRLPDMKAGEELEVNVIEVDAGRNSLIFGLGGPEHAQGGSGRREGGERSERGDRPDRGERGDRGERRGRRDGDRGGFAPPARPVDEIKSAETVGNFSLGDLLGDQIKSKLGVKQEKQRREPRPQADAGTGPAADAPSRQATPEAAATPEAEPHDLGGGPPPAMFNQPMDMNTASRAELPLQSQDAAESLTEMAEKAHGTPAEAQGSAEETSNPPIAPEGAPADTPTEDPAQPKDREPDGPAGNQDANN